MTDPPYNVAVVQETNTIHGRTIKNDSMPEENFYEFLLAFLKSAEGTMKSGAAFYIWHADSTSKTFREALEPAGLTLKQNLIWVKSQIVLGRQDYQWRHEPCLYGWKEGAAHYFIDSRKKATVFEDMPRLADMNREQLIELVKEMQDGTIATTVIHEDKPVRSDEHPTMKPVKLISRLILNSSREGDIILDPFGGSGTTLIAAEQLGRTCYMMELDPQFADVILARWEKLTGETAEVIDG